MDNKETLGEIRKALEDPKLYSSGEGKKRLRAAFDMLTSQVYKDLFDEELKSRIDARQRLNACEKKDYEGKWSIIVLLREAIRESETSLHAKGYTDHVDATEAFINKCLRPLYKTLA